MISIMNENRSLLPVVISLFISGCGGGGGGSSPSAGNSASNVVSFTGTVYADESLVNAALQIKCANGASGNGYTNSIGAYSIEIQNPQYPCLIRASGGIAGNRTNNENIYSVALQNSNLISSLITNYGLLTSSASLDGDFSSPDFSKYNSTYLTQVINNLDYRLSVAGYLSSLSNFSTNSAFEKEIIKNFSKSLYYKSIKSPQFITIVSQTSPTANTDISYSPYYSGFNYRITSISDLYWAKSYGIYKNNSLIDWILYPKPISDYYSIANPELYNLIVPAIEKNENGRLDLWVETTYPNPSASATLFVNNVASGEYSFTYTSISRAWYP